MKRRFKDAFGASPHAHKKDGNSIISPEANLPQPTWCCVTADISVRRVLVASVCTHSLCIVGLHLVDKGASDIGSNDSLLLESVKAASVGAAGALYAEYLKDPSLGVIFPIWVPPTPAVHSLMAKLLQALSADLGVASLGGGLVSAGWGLVASLEASILRSSLQKSQKSWNETPYSVLKCCGAEESSNVADWRSVASLVSGKVGLGASANILLPRGVKTPSLLSTTSATPTDRPPTWTPLQTATSTLLYGRSTAPPTSDIAAKTTTTRTTSTGNGFYTGYFSLPSCENLPPPHNLTSPPFITPQKGFYCFTPSHTPCSSMAE